MFRHDPGRSAATDTPAPAALRAIWGRRLTAAASDAAIVAGDWPLKRFTPDAITEATVADDKVFVALTDERKLVAVDPRGGIAWTYATPARLDAPPAVSAGRCLLGCHDG